jgi:Outer membrane protein beta-barrel domain
MRFMVIVAFALAFLLPHVASAQNTFGVGLRASAMSMAADGDHENAEAMQGGGLQVRWRFARRWGLELTAEGLTHRVGEVYERKAVPATLSVRFHIFPSSAWDLYGILGVGATHEEVLIHKSDGTEIEQTFEESHAHLGIGLERVFGPFGIAAELRAVAAAREDREAAQPYDAVPGESSGGMMNIAVTYYF